MRLTASLLVACLALVACGSGDADGPATAAGFSAPLVTGGTFDSAETTGATVLWFWAPT
jgi:hypothetical protein